MIELVILFSLTVCILVYVYVSYHEKSYVNFLTPIYFTFIPSIYIFELLNIHFFGYSGSFHAYLYCFTTYALNFAVMAIVYIHVSIKPLKLPFTINTDFKYLPYLFLILSFVIYLPILIQFHEYLFSPREIYARTRAGFGPIFFISTTLTLIAFILILFKQRKTQLEFLIFSMLCMAQAFLHGRKSDIVFLILIWLLYKVFVENWRISLGAFLTYGTVFSLAVMGLFYMYSLGQHRRLNLIQYISTYSNYTRNAMKVIDDPDLNPQYGRLTLENTIYARVPRVLYPDKPKDFGSYYLARRYYPIWFEKNTGLPSFGLIGVPYADFGDLAVFYIILWAAISGLLLKLFMVRLKKYRSPPDFILVLFLSGVSILNLGTGYLLPEHIVLALIIALLGKIRLTAKPRSSSKRLVLKQKAVQETELEKLP